MSDYITTLSAILTPVVAATGTFIAVQQWRISDRKLRHELYERRLQIYNALMDFLGIIGSEANVSHEQLINFLRKTQESHFLFSDEIRIYLKVIYDAGVDVHTQHEMISGRGG